MYYKYISTIKIKITPYKRSKQSVENLIILIEYFIHNAIRIDRCNVRSRLKFAQSEVTGRKINIRLLKK